MFVAPELQERLNRMWYKLQRFYQERNPGISQFDLDDACVVDLEIHIQEVIGKPYPPAESVT